MSSGVILRVRHLRAAKLCMSGGREYFARRSWSWDDFLTNGRPVDDFGDCPLVARAAALAREEAERG